MPEGSGRYGKVIKLGRVISQLRLLLDYLGRPTDDMSSPLQTLTDVVVRRTDC